MKAKTRIPSFQKPLDICQWKKFLMNSSRPFLDNQVIVRVVKNNTIDYHSTHGAHWLLIVLDEIFEVLSEYARRHNGQRSDSLFPIHLRIETSLVKKQTVFAVETIKHPSKNCAATYPRCPTALVRQRVVFAYETFQQSCEKRWTFCGVLNAETINEHFTINSYGLISLIYYHSIIIITIVVVILIEYWLKYYYSVLNLYRRSDAICLSWLNVDAFGRRLFLRGAELQQQRNGVDISDCCRSFQRCYIVLCKKNELKLNLNTASRVTQLFNRKYVIQFQAVTGLSRTIWKPEGRNS